MALYRSLMGTLFLISNEIYNCNEQSAIDGWLSSPDNFIKQKSKHQRLQRRTAMSQEVKLLQTEHIVEHFHRFLTVNRVSIKNKRARKEAYCTGEFCVPYDSFRCMKAHTGMAFSWILNLVTYTWGRFKIITWVHFEWNTLNNKKISQEIFSTKLTLENVVFPVFGKYKPPFLLSLSPNTTVCGA